MTSAKKAAPKQVTVKVTCDRLVLDGGAVFVRDQELTIGKDITPAEVASWGAAGRVSHG